MLNDDRPDFFTFGLLGPVRAWRGGIEVDLGSPQQRTTLAMLLLREGSVVTLDELITGLWGDDLPRSAATTIRTYVSRLRAVFGPGGQAGTRIESTGGGYVIRSPRVGIDLFRFARHTAAGAAAARLGDWHTVASELQAAVELSGGQPLAGVLGPYAQVQRARLQQLVVTAHVDLVQARIHQGRHREVLPELTAMVSDHPLWEDVHALFMTALAGSGRVAEALDHYQSARRVLVGELGIEPGARLRRTHQQILSFDDGPGNAAPPAARRVRRMVPGPPRRRHHLRLARCRSDQ